MSATEDPRPADAIASSWVDRYADENVRPYLRLIRADRPIGVWLLLWPCWWSLWAGAFQAGREFDLNVAGLGLTLATQMLVFALGAFVMRGAGCTYNDIVDRDIDAKVARTAQRPIPSGQVSVQTAWLFLAMLLVIGLVVLLQLNRFAVVLGALSLIPIAIYPFMKRVTDWPQAFLGLTFNWGALLGWAAMTGGLGFVPMLIFIGAVFWTLGYDTIYAHQDKDDDELIGVRSTARLLGANSKIWVGGFYVIAGVCWAAAGGVIGFGFGFWLGLIAVCAHFAWQIRRLDVSHAENCLMVFRSNRDLGALMFGAIVAGVLTA